MKDSSFNSVFNYLDYRKYLTDFYNFKKANNKRFSYQLLCEKVGIKSKGHFTLILQGKANVSIPLALKIGEYLKFNKKELEYFQYLILYNQAKSHNEKKKYFDKMISFKESIVYILNSSQYEFFSKWYHSIIRSIIEIFPCNDESCSEISKMISPQLSAEEVKKSLELLEKLTLVSKNPETGFYFPTEKSIDIGNEVREIGIDTIAVQTLKLAQNAIDSFAYHERFFSGSTIGVSLHAYQQIVNEIKEFRARIHTIVENDHADPDRVYHFGVQIFPVSLRRQS